MTMCSHRTRLMQSQTLCVVAALAAALAAERGVHASAQSNGERLFDRVRARMDGASAGT